MRVSPEVEIAFSLATREAQRRRHEFVTVEHLLYALLFDEETAQILRHAGADTGGLKKKLEKFLDDEIPAMPEETSPSLSILIAVNLAVRGCQRRSLPSTSSLRWSECCGDMRFVM